MTDLVALWFAERGLKAFPGILTEYLIGNVSRLQEEGKHSNSYAKVQIRVCSFQGVSAPPGLQSGLSKLGALLLQAGTQARVWLWLQGGCRDTHSTCLQLLITWEKHTMNTVR